MSGMRTPDLSAISEAHTLGLGWIINSGIRHPNGGVRSKYNWRIKEYSSWSPRASSCLLCTAGAIRLFIEEGLNDLARGSGEHLLSLRLPPGERFAGLFVEPGARMIQPNYVFYAIEALLDLAHTTGESRFADAAFSAAEVLIRYALRRDGSLAPLHLQPMLHRIRTVVYESKTVDVASVVPLLRLADYAAGTAGERRYRQGADHLLRFWKRHAHRDGWLPFAQPSFGMRVLRRLRRTGRQNAHPERTLAPEMLVHPASIGQGIRTLLVMGEAERAQTSFAWLVRGLSSRGLLHQWYRSDASPASAEEDVMPTALLALLAMAFPVADGDDLVKRIASGLLAAQERRPEHTAVHGGFYGLPGDPLNETILYAWDSIFATWALGRLTRRLCEGLSAAAHSRPAARGLMADPLRPLVTVPLTQV
jgi:hypothetical protein